MSRAKQPRCPKCKDNGYAFDYKAGLCVQCAPIDWNAPAYVPGVSLFDRVRYADMDRMAQIEMGEL